MELDLNQWYRLTSAGGEVSHAYLYHNPDAKLDGFSFGTHDGGGFLPLFDLTSDTEVQPCTVLLTADYDKLRNDFAQLVVAAGGLLKQLREHTQDATSDTVMVQSILNRRVEVLTDNGQVV